MNGRRGAWLFLALVAGPVLAGPQDGKLEVTVKDAVTHDLLPGAVVDLVKSGQHRYESANQQGVAVFDPVAVGDYEYTAVMPECYQWKQGTVGVGAYPPATCITVELDRIAPDVAVEVIQPTGGQVGGTVEARYRIRYQPMVYEPRKLYLWAWDTVGYKSFVLYSDTDYGIASHGSEAISTSWPADGVCLMTFRFYWDTLSHQNGIHALRIAAEFSNPFGDPIWRGSPPPDAQHDGEPGGASGSADVLNMVITSYSTSNGTQDYLKYDPDGGEGLSRPQVTFTIEDAAPSPMRCALYLIPTQQVPLTNLLYSSAYAHTYVDVAGPGTHTVTWNGSLAPGEQEDECAWGTYAFDVYAYKPSWDTAWDTASAKQPYSLWCHATYGHDVLWEVADQEDAADLRAKYGLESWVGQEPTDLQMVACDSTLSERGDASGPVALNTYHAGADGDGIAVATVSPASDNVGGATFSMDGQKVAYERFYLSPGIGRSGQWVWVYDRQSKRSRRIDAGGLSSAAALANPLWSPVDDRLALDLVQPDGTRRTVVLQNEGGVLVPVPYAGRGHDWSAGVEWSPTGDALLVCQSPNRGLAKRSLAIAATRPGEPVQMSGSLADRVYDACWSPDGGRIAVLHGLSPDTSPVPLGSTAVTVFDRHDLQRFTGVFAPRGLRIDAIDW